MQKPRKEKRMKSKRSKVEKIVKPLQFWKQWLLSHWWWGTLIHVQASRVSQCGEPPCNVLFGFSQREHHNPHRRNPFSAKGSQDKGSNAGLLQEQSERKRERWTPVAGLLQEPVHINFQRSTFQIYVNSFFKVWNDKRKKQQHYISSVVHFFFQQISLLQADREWKKEGRMKERKNEWMNDDFIGFFSFFSFFFFSFCSFCSPWNWSWVTRQLMSTVGSIVKQHESSFSIPLWKQVDPPFFHNCPLKIVKLHCGTPNRWCGPGQACCEWSLFLPLIR